MPRTLCERARWWPGSVGAARLRQLSGTTQQSGQKQLGQLLSTRGSRRTAGGDAVTAATSRALLTRQSLLTAAREVFCSAGFNDAAVADVVARAGASVGSLYHHFGGKADLYLALYEDYANRQEQR